MYGAHSAFRARLAYSIALHDADSAKSLLVPCVCVAAATSSRTHVLLEAGRFAARCPLLLPWLQAYEGFTQNPDLKFLHGWAVSQAVLLKLLPQQQSVKAYPNTADEVTDIRQQMTELGQMSLTGFVETYT